MGITINGSPNEALLKPSNLKFIQSKEDETKESYFELTEMDGKGIGMIAACNISAGTIIFTDTALLNISRTLSDKDNESKQAHIMNQFALLSKEKKEKVLSYHIQIDIKHKDKDDDKSEAAAVLPIYFTNSYTIKNDASQYESGFFPLIARMNHSCFSNCEVLDYDVESESRSVVALLIFQKAQNCQFITSETRIIR